MQRIQQYLSWLRMFLVVTISLAASGCCVRTRYHHRDHHRHDHVRHDLMPYGRHR